MGTTEIEREAGEETVRAQATSVAEVQVSAGPPVYVEDKPMSPALRSGVAVGVVVFATLLITQLLAIWPAVIRASSTDATPSMPETAVLFGIWTTRFDQEVVLLLMVLIVGALSALIGVTRRFLYYAHRDQLTTRDGWSYLLRPFQGALLALIMYFALRGGFLGQDGAAPINPYGVAAIAGLVGLFTRHAVSKLGEIFDAALGKPTEDQDRLITDREADESAATDGDASRRNGGGPARRAAARRRPRARGATRPR